MSHDVSRDTVLTFSGAKFQKVPILSTQGNVKEKSLNFKNESTFFQFWSEIVVDFLVDYFVIWTIPFKTLSLLSLYLLFIDLKYSQAYESSCISLYSFLNLSTLY